MKKREKEIEMTKRFCINTDNIKFAHNTDETPIASLETSHCHDTYEILFIVEGRGKYILEGSEIPVAPGTLLFAKPLEYHCIKIEPTPLYERFIIHFGPSAILPEMRAVFEESVCPGGANFFSAASFSESLSSLFERFAFAQTLPEEKRQLYMQLVLSELIMLLSVSDGKVNTASDGELGAKVIKYLNDNIDKSVSLDKIAKRFFVSKYYLCRAFKKHNGISVHGYINRKRVMLAKQMMEMGETASGAAYRVGFGDYSAFYRAYTKVLGEAPSTRGIKKNGEGEENGI